MPLLPAMWGFVPQVFVASPRGAAPRLPGEESGPFPWFFGLGMAEAGCYLRSAASEMCLISLGIKGCICHRSTDHGSDKRE